MKDEKTIIEMYNNVWDEYSKCCMNYKACKTDYILYRREHYLKGFCDALEIILNSEDV